MNKLRNFFYFGGPRTFLARPKFHYTIVLEVLSSDFRINTAQKELPKFGHYYLLIFNKNFAIIFIEGKGKRKQQKEIKKKLKNLLTNRDTSAIIKIQDRKECRTSIKVQVVNFLKKRLIA